MILSFKHIGSLSRSFIAPALLIAAIGCREDAESPSGPSAEPASSPVASLPVAGFVQLSGGDSHTCGITSERRAFCWGFGLLGDGQTYRLSATPVAVAGSLEFRQVSAGTDHFCGITLDRRAYCWGGNSSGQIGDGTTEDRWTPVAVAGGRQFQSVDAGFFHTCALTYPGGQAYCWGSNFRGKLGDGSILNRTTPAAVVGGHSFRHITAGLGSQLWRHSGQPGLLLGQQHRRPGGRRLGPEPAAAAGAGGGGPRVPAAGRRGIPHLRSDHGGQRFLLGPGHVRPDRRRRLRGATVAQRRRRRERLQPADRGLLPRVR